MVNFSDPAIIELGLGAHTFATSSLWSLEKIMNPILNSGAQEYLAHHLRCLRVSLLILIYVSRVVQSPLPVGSL